MDFAVTPGYTDAPLPAEPRPGNAERPAKDWRAHRPGLAIAMCPPIRAKEVSRAATPELRRERRAGPDEAGAPVRVGSLSAGDHVVGGGVSSTCLSVAQ
jgi:hypothetical protein